MKQLIKYIQEGIKLSSKSKVNIADERKEKQHEDFVNFFKIDICVSEVQDMFSQFAHIFEFESIDMPGQTNTSVAESIKQCLADPDIKGMITSCPIYSIYVKSSER